MTEQNTTPDATTLPDERELTALAAAHLAADVPETLVVLPWGDIESTAGSFSVDDEAAEAVIDAFTAHGTDLPIDYEHQTLGGAFASPQGKAPAAGWITRLSFTPGEGVIAAVSWTDEGRQLLAAKAYRYLSPVALVRKRDRKVMALHSVALTNKPAIVGMTPVVHRQPDPEDAPDVEREAAALVTLSEKLALGTNTDAATVLCAAQARIEQLEAATARRDAEALIDEALQGGKLTEAQREWAVALALRDPQCYREWASTAPVVTQPGRIAFSAADDTHESLRRQAARTEYRACGALHGLTSEQAYIADALRRRPA